MAVVRAGAAPASAGWSRPVAVGAPQTGDIAPIRLAASPDGAVAIAWTVADRDHGTSIGTFLAVAPDGRPVAGSARMLPYPDTMLDLAAPVSGGFALLAGESASGRRCCAAVRLRSTTESGARLRARTVAKGFGGSLRGGLVPLSPGGLLAVLAGVDGIVSAFAPTPIAPFHRPIRLSPAGVGPAALAWTALPTGGSAIAFAQPDAPAGPARAVELAVGSRDGAWSGPPRRVLGATGGGAVDEIALVAGRAGPVLADIEAVPQGDSGPPSRVRALDAAPAPPVSAQPQTLDQPGSGLADADLVLASGADGTVASAWERCAPAAVACAVLATVRRPNAPRFETPHALGMADAGESPALAVGPDGRVVLGWVRRGGVRVRRRAGRSAAWGAPVTLSRGSSGSLALAVAPGGRAVAAWVEGTAPARVLAARSDRS